MSSKVILITGSSSGIGQVCAEYLSQRGHRVYGTSRKTPQKETPYELINMDVNDDASVKRGISYIMEKEGLLDVVINNAGFGIAGAVEDTSIEEMKFQFETNFFGVLRVCNEVLPLMRTQQFGYIINIGSIAGLIGVPFQGAYSASKSALKGLTEVMRMEVKPFGIHTVLIEPGDFNTGFTENRILTKSSQSNSPYSKRFKSGLQSSEEDELKGSDPKKIAELLDYIINHPSPRPQYRVGPILERFAVHLRKYIPSKLFEKIIMKNYNV
ncbi:SDR family oxidoreductase [Xanthovirga aplysinae]|uniref:SDR family oxidoreductase n=1 Tax=Xanthovirga aplysinae TaxID=2529853 RepID=UPI0012BC0A7C|nr:SDR family oxidoreductase [Xanthovirga aplysinae]MTI30278.1 SDR family oxidoreductase [Xanthovirga aplysinae]